MTDQPLRRRETLYPNHYVWLVFIAAMDIMMTCLVLYRGGSEMNILASTIIGRFGLPGMVAFKFMIVVFVIVLCEIAGRMSLRAGKTLAQVSIVLNSVPVLVAFALLLVRG